MYHIVKYLGGIKLFLNRNGQFVVATNSLYEFVSVANAMYTLDNMISSDEKAFGDIKIVGPRGGQYGVRSQNLKTLDSILKV